MLQRTGSRARRGPRKEIPMADVNRGARPLSPHLSIYKPEQNMVMSISHRITGVGLTLGAGLVSWWLLAAATSAEQFALVDGLLTSWLGALVLLGSVAALWYHTLNGVRHLWWDTGRGYALDQVDRSGKLVLIGTAVLTVLTVLAV
jgi:succinate dehydrogenase / fumarate reductase cytochrome b subunit